MGPPPTDIALAATHTRANDLRWPRRQPMATFFFIVSPCFRLSTRLQINGLRRRSRQRPFLIFIPLHCACGRERSPATVLELSCRRAVQAVAAKNPYLRGDGHEQVQQPQADKAQRMRRGLARAVHTPCLRTQRHPPPPCAPRRSGSVGRSPAPSADRTLRRRAARLRESCDVRRQKRHCGDHRFTAAACASGGCRYPQQRTRTEGQEGPVMESRRT